MIVKIKKRVKRPAGYIEKGKIITVTNGYGKELIDQGFAERMKDNNYREERILKAEKMNE